MRKGQNTHHSKQDNPDRLNGEDCPANALASSYPIPNITSEEITMKCHVPTPLNGYRHADIAHGIYDPADYRAQLFCEIESIKTDVK